MYRHTDILDVRRVPKRNTRAAIRYKFYTERYDNKDYKNSPYYKGAELWDMLPLATIECASIFEFKKCLWAGLKHMLYEMYFGIMQYCTEFNVFVRVTNTSCME